MRALVTGAAGFVGRHMTAELQRRGWDVYAVDINGVPYPRDVLDLFRGSATIYDLIVHAAAQSPHRAAIDGQPATHIYNQMLDATMFDWAVRTGQGRVLYFSSCAALDEKPDDYGLLKLTGERMAAQARRAGLPVTVVRPYSGYGEDQSENFPFRAIIERARRREDPFTIWGSGQQVRDWVHVSDVVAGALAVVDSGTEDPVDLCTGIGTSMLELAGLACEAVGYEPEFELRMDKPAGVPYRVGDPTRLHEYYKPAVTVAEGVERALTC
jgi:nucleoside-diphosphate-sugar epimerase